MPVAITSAVPYAILTEHGASQHRVQAEDERKVSRDRPHGIKRAASGRAVERGAVDVVAGMSEAETRR